MTGNLKGVEQMPLLCLDVSLFNTLNYGEVFCLNSIFTLEEENTIGMFGHEELALEKQALLQSLISKLQDHGVLVKLFLPFCPCSFYSIWLQVDGLLIISHHLCNP